MTEKTIYVSEDGHEFHTQAACLAYEESQEIIDYLVNHPDELTSSHKTIATIVNMLLDQYNITKKSTK
jgi:hypothetical protein